MLRLVATRSTRAAPPRCVALWALDGELADYLARRLRTQWPRLHPIRVSDRDPIATIAADLWICGAMPPVAPAAPTLCLGEVQRPAGLRRVGERLWTCPMPITGRQLLRAVDGMLAQVG